MLTEFGKKVRKLRIDKGVRLKDMAEYLDVSSAYLSAVETGKKKASKNILEGIAKYFKLKGEQKAELLQIAAQSAEEVKINLKGMSDDSIETATAFARKFPNMKPIDMKELMKLLEKVRDKER